jgi:uncharacterized caspase-like protein
MIVNSREKQSIVRNTWAFALTLALGACAHRSIAQVEQLPEPSKRFALIVGVEDYSDGITTLKGPDKDAHEIKRALETYAGFPGDQIDILTSEEKDGSKPSHNQILKRLDRFASLVPKDGLLVFAFSGHGTEENNEVFLLPSDAELGSPTLIENTSISLKVLREAISRIKVKQVIILLDACRDNPEVSKGVGDNHLTSAYRMKGTDWNKVNTGIEAFAVVYATEEGKRAYIAPAQKQGYFSLEFVEALSGKAKDANNLVTLGSLVTFLQDRVPKMVSADLGPTKIQKPFADVRGYKADALVLSRVPQVDTNLKYVIDVHIRPIIGVSVSLAVGVTVGAGSPGEEMKWMDQVKDGTQVITEYDYTLPLPQGKSIVGWSYEVDIIHVQPHDLIRISLSDKEPVGNGVRTSVTSDGRVIVDVGQAAQDWR